MSVDPRSHELDFLERKLPVFASRLEDLFLDRDYLAQVQSTALQKTNSALSLTSLSTVKAVNMIETCLDVLQNYFQFQNKKLEEKMTEISDLQIQNEALKKEKGAGRSIMKKVGDQMTTDKRQLEINFRRIEKDYDACREELKKQNKLRLDGEKRIYLLESEKEKLLLAIRKGGFSVEEEGGLRPGFSEAPKEMRPPQPSKAELSPNNPNLPKKRLSPTRVDPQEQDVMNQLDGLEQEFEKTGFGRAPSPSSYGPTRSTSVYLPRSNTSQPMLPTQQNPQPSRQFQSHATLHPPQGGQFRANSPTNRPMSFHAGTQSSPIQRSTSPFPRMEQFQNTLAAFKKRYLGEGKEFWVEDFPDTSIAALKLYMGQKVKFVCELMQQCTSPAWKMEYVQRSREMAFALAGFYDALSIVISRCPNLPQDVAMFNKILESAFVSTDPAVRCLEHAFRGNDISASPLKSFLIEVLKTLREVA